MVVLRFQVREEEGMPTNDANVQRIITDAIGTASDDGDPCCGRLGNAFRALQAQRQQPGHSLDLDLAAAEHYMFARWMVCTGFVSPTQMRVLTSGYDLKKRLDRLLGSPNREQVTSNPVSPPDRDVVRWGHLGVDAEAVDHDVCNAGTKPPLWRSLEEIFGEGRGVGPY
jgi:hypothetical protein